MEPWQMIEEPVSTKVGWRIIVKKVYRDPDGERLEAFTKDAIGRKNVAVIALTEKNTVIVNEMFRPGPGMVMYELPGGGAFEEEDKLEQAALRELKEETGYTTDNVVHIGKVYKDAWGNAESHYFLARNCVKTDEQQLDKEEFIRPVEITIDKLIDNARSGLMTDTDGVFLGYDILKEIQEGNT